MSDVHDEQGHRTKRFKYQSYNEQLKDVHAPSILGKSKVEEALEDEESLFHGALSHWMQLNLSPSFITFAQKASPLSQSLPLLIHSWKEVTDLWLEHVRKADEEAMKALLDLLQKLIEDLRTTVAPAYELLLHCLLELLPRRVAPEILSAVLAALLAVLKHIFVPLVPKHEDIDALSITWMYLATTVVKCNLEVQRAVSEVWSSILRRLKKEDRRRCILLMMASSQTSNEFVTWSFVFAMKSVAQTIHTCGPQIIVSCLDYHLVASAEEKDASAKLLRRLLTALVHHCSKPEQFSVVVDPLVEKLAAITQVEDIKRLLEVMVVPCSVRQGSRLTSKQISTILDITTKLSYDKTLSVPLLTTMVAAISASSADLAVWMGAGRRAIEHAWSVDPALAVSLTGALHEIEWKGFNQFALPPFIKHSLDLLVPLEESKESDSQMQVQALRVLAKLAKNNMLKGMDGAWRSQLTNSICAWLERFAASENSVIILVEVIPLLPILSSRDLLVSLISIAQRLVVDETEVEAEYNSSPMNDTFVFGQVVRILSKSKRSIFPPDFDAAKLVCMAVNKWSWSEYVMDGIVDLAKSCDHSDPGSINDRDNIVEQLTNNLKSHSHVIRRSSLELLSLPWLCPDGVIDGVQRSLAAEVIPLTVQGVRERVLLTGRVGQVAVDDERVARVCVTWLLGQLKVGLRPVWSPAVRALASLSGKTPDIVWDLVFSELNGLEPSVQNVRMPAWLAEEAGEEDGVNEEERTWRDPSAHNFRISISKWTSNVGCRYAIIEVQKPRDRFDARSYEAQLLVALGEFSSLAEKHSRQLVPLLLSFASPSASEKASRVKLANWLKLFAKFTNPKAFHSSSAVHALYIQLLAHPDRSLQSTALSCLQTFKTPALSRKADMLTNLLDDTKWRDELTTLDISELSLEERKELVPIIIRLFYGMMRERGGRGKGADRRSALLGALGLSTEEELTLLVDLMVEPFLDQVNFDLSDGDNRKQWRIGDGVSLNSSEKQQIGFLMLLADVLRNLGMRVIESWPKLIALTLTLTAHAQRELQGATEDTEEIGDGFEVENEGEKEAEKIVNHSSTRQRQMRLIRQLGLKRLTEFFNLSVEFDFEPYMAELYRTVISPRIPLLDRENTQAPSSLLELLVVWSLRPDTAVFLVQYDQRTLTKVFDCLVATNVKPSVQMRIFDLLERLLAFSSEDYTFADTVMKPYMSGLLDNLATAVQRSTGDGSVPAVGGIAQREIAVLSKLSPYVTVSSQAATLLSLFLPQLSRVGRSVPEKAKADMLEIICNLMPRIADFVESQAALFSKTYDTLSQLYQLLRGRQARITLTTAFNALANIDTSLSSTANLLASLNSYSATRIEEPDFDQRLSAFATLNEERWQFLSGREWKPFLHCMLYFIQDEEELSIRTNASLSMKRFLESLSAAQDADMQASFVRILFPGIKRHLRTKSDIVRAEVMGVLAFAVEKCENVNALQEMQILLAAGDEEASFFNNVFHIQIHRRTRALRRLAEFCDEPGFRSSTLQEIFVPVVNSFISGSGTVDHHLVNEAITTLGRIAKHLAWPAYFSLVQQYIKLATDKNAAERAYTRALVSILDNFHFSLEDTFTEEPEEPVDREDAEPVKAPSATMKIHDAVVNRLLPTLLKHLEQRDELEDSNRISLAIGIAKVSLHLPEESRDVQIPRLLTVLSQIFRSKSQETRDISRETLCRITVMLGSSYLPTIVRQLREALLRGPHLHVLAFVTHSLLVHLTSPENVASLGCLDESVPDIVHVSAEVVFGRSGKDVESEGFKTKMKEVRNSSSKGMDSFAILAKHITPAATSNLLLSIKVIMQETQSVKMMQKVDEVLRRMAVGINTNIHFGPSELLAFCHTLISQNARFFQERARVQKRKPKKVNDATVQLKRKIEPDNDHYSHNSWRFVTFGLDLFNTAYRRGRFDFKDAKIIARLEPMVNVIGNTLYASNGSVISSGLKATAQIAKAPLKNVEKSLPIFVRQTMQIVRETGSTEAEVVQTAFKTLAAIIRDCSSSQVKEKDLTFLLELLTPDLEEITRQANAFALLRAIVSRRFIVPEIYDLMDRVGEIMVTSQSSQAQEQCRSVLLQFLIDYPQGKTRLKQHFTFLVKNLSYVFESGRKSVMELLSAVLLKFNDDIIAEYADMLFVALVLVIANDDSTKCREMAAQLVKTLVGRLREEQKKTIISHVHVWAAQRHNPALARVSSQTYGLILDTLKEDAKPYLPTLLDDVNMKIRDAAAEFEEMEDADEDVLISEAEWQIPYQALTTLSKVIHHFPHIISDHDKVSWPSIASLLLYPHTWVRTASCRLLGSLFSVTPTPVGTPPDEDQFADDFPLSRAGMREVANALSLQLKSENLDEALSLQIVKNLFYIGKCFCAVPVPVVEMEPSAGVGAEGVREGVEDDVDIEDRDEDEDGISEDEEDDGRVEKAVPSEHNPLPWLFSRLSYQARSAHIARLNKPTQNPNWSRQVTAIFQWFAAMASYMDGERLERFLPHILPPVYRIAEDEVVRDATMDALKSLTSELQDLLQTKVGVTAFARVYASIRSRVSSVRRERRTKRVVRRTVDPVGAAGSERRRRERGKEKEKRKRGREVLGERKVTKRRRTG